MLNIRPSTRKQAKIKLALQGCAGSGKTYSALLLAYGMTSDWSKIRFRKWLCRSLCSPRDLQCGLPRW